MILDFAKKKDTFDFVYLIHIKLKSLCSVFKLLIASFKWVVVGWQLGAGNVFT